MDMISHLAVDKETKYQTRTLSYCSPEPPGPNASHSKECLNRRPGKVVRQRQAELSEVQASLVCKISSRSARARVRSCLKKKQRKKQRQRENRKDTLDTGQKKKKKKAQ